MKYIKIILISLVIIFSLFILTGCTPNIKEGVIIDKYYRSKYITTTTIYNGKFITPMVISHPESYQFKIELEIDEEIKNNIITVDKETYEKYELGDYYKK